jgi:hypothetical protein
MPDNGERARGDVEAALVAGLSQAQQTSELGVLALLLARRLDEGVEVLYDDEHGPTIVQVSARDTAGLVKELRAVLSDLRERMPATKPDSKVADLKEQRDKRRAR